MCGALDCQPGDIFTVTSRAGVPEGS
ncbi:MAG: hypothetical protein H0T78_02625 [Longispora sp.]|nr:hypothetical protein [Longispora sp. (in: high G+C Gram-positive bacteria)]